MCGMSCWHPSIVYRDHPLLQGSWISKFSAGRHPDILESVADFTIVSTSGTSSRRSLSHSVS
jgi:hypothetical protein